MCKPGGWIDYFVITYGPRPGKAFRVGHPGLRERANSIFAVIKGETTPRRIDDAMQGQAISRIEQVKNDARRLFYCRASEFIIWVSHEKIRGSVRCLDDLQAVPIHQLDAVR